MHIKPGASIRGIQSEIIIGLMAIEPIFLSYGSELTITAGTDGKHKEGSLHYKGLAVDIRSRDLQEGDRIRVLEEGKSALGDEFDFISEADHFHLEFDPKA